MRNPIDWRHRTATILVLLGVGSWSTTTTGPAPNARAEQKVAKTKDRKLTHEETLRWIAEHKAWRTAKKTRPIFARVVEPDEVGKEYRTADHSVEKARAGFWLCVGVAEEPWFQTLEKIEGKYQFAGEVKRSFPFDMKKSHTYREYRPKGEVRNLAARVEGEGIVGFFIRPNYDPDHPLYSPAGGYVVTDDVPDPYRVPLKDVWLVQESLFKSTYEIVR